MIILNMDNKKDIVFWLLVLLVVGLCIYFLFFIKSESGQCVISPLTYGVSKYESELGEFTCTCSSPGANPILVTRDGISQMNNADTFLLPNSTLYS